MDPFPARATVMPVRYSDRHREWFRFLSLPRSILRHGAPRELMNDRGCVVSFAVAEATELNVTLFIQSPRPTTLRRTTDRANKSLPWRHARYARFVRPIELGYGTPLRDIRRQHSKTNDHEFLAILSSVRSRAVIPHSTLIFPTRQRFRVVVRIRRFL